LRGRGVPITRFEDIRDYADIDLLEKVSFESVLRIRKNLKPEHRLAAEGMLALVREFGLQTAFKRFNRFSRLQWKYWNKRLLLHKVDAPDVKSLMKKSTRDWLEDRFRFPRVLVRNRNGVHSVENSSTDERATS
jgi:hypothetical protein